MNRHGFSHRRGVTLLELLVTIGIILAITAAVIPVMAPAMAGRRLREASRGVNTFVASARNRALVTGRPVGVMFERLSAEPQASTVLSMVEVPAAWSGADTRTVMRIDDRGRVIGIGFVDTASGNWISDDFWYGLIRPGDQVEINHRGQRFRLWNGEPFADWNANGKWDSNEPYVDTNLDNGCTDGEQLLSQLQGPRQGDPTQAVTFKLPGPQPPNAGGFTVNNSVLWALGYDDPRSAMDLPRIPQGDYAFKIIRQPVKSSAASFQLPVGTVVDLGVSGIDQGDYFAPLNDTDTAPVILLFAPNGSVDRVWCRDGMAAGGPVGSGSYLWKSKRPTSAVSFLIGQRDGVGLTVPANESPDVQPNWFDLANVWVTVNSQTGAVLSNPNASVFDTSDQQVTQPPTEGDEANARELLKQARAFAQQGQSMGGK